MVSYLMEDILIYARVSKKTPKDLRENSHHEGNNVEHGRSHNACDGDPSHFYRGSAFFTPAGNHAPQAVIN